MAYRADAETMAQQERHHAALGGQNHDRLHMVKTDGEDTTAEPSVVQKMLSATAGSILTSLLVTPLDVVRVRLQSQNHKPAPGIGQAIPRSPSTIPREFANLPSNLGISACCREVFWINNNAAYCVAGPNASLVNNATGTTHIGAECAAEEVQRKTFTSTLDGLRKIAQNEGPRTLWRGLTPTLVMAVPANVIYFAGYDWLRASPKSPIRKVSMNDNYAPLAAGSFARVLAAVAVSPIEMFRTRMQAAHTPTTAAGHFRDTLQSMVDTVGTKGYRSLWTGLNLTLWRDVPFSAIYWWGYETGRNVLTNMRETKRGRERISGRGADAWKRRSRSRSQENHATTLVDSFIAGATSGAVAAFVTTPFDVGKTRQQVIKHARDAPRPTAHGAVVHPEELSMPRFLLHIFREEGAQGLFRGWAARCMKVAPACAIMISSYEVGKKMAGNVNERLHQTEEDYD